MNSRPTLDRMSNQLTRKSSAVAPRLNLGNTMAFPRELREAIPDMATCIGRVLKIDSMEGKASNTELYGPRVLLKLVVKETGKLKGEFVVRMELEPEAARTL